MEFQISITGLEELIAKVQSPQLMGEPLRGFFTKSTLTLQRAAQMRTPVDTGRLRASETTAVDPSPMPLWGRVGTNVIYAPFVEFNTRPHFPPPSALAGWAQRHGTNPYALAHAIRRRGTIGKHMFEQSMKDNQGQMNAFLQQAATEIETRWSGGNIGH